MIQAIDKSGLADTVMTVGKTPQWESVHSIDVLIILYQRELVFTMTYRNKVRNIIFIRLGLFFIDVRNPQTYSGQKNCTLILVGDAFFCNVHA
jgi:hypothetical protein